MRLEKLCQGMLIGSATALLCATVSSVGMIGYQEFNKNSPLNIARQECIMAEKSLEESELRFKQLREKMAEPITYVRTVPIDTTGDGIFDSHYVEEKTIPTRGTPTFVPTPAFFPPQREGETLRVKY